MWYIWLLSCECLAVIMQYIWLLSCECVVVIVWMSGCYHVIYLVVLISDLTPLMKDERRRRSQLNRSSSLFDLSASRRTDAEDHRHAAGSQLPGASAKPVPDSESEVKRHISGDIEESSKNSRQRRRALDVATSRRMPRALNLSLFISVVGLQLWAALKQTFVENSLSTV